MDPADATALQGPGSLSSRDEECNDFVILDSQASGFTEPEVDPFTSLSQADAVAQVKELMSQRDTLQSMSLRIASR